MPAFDDVARLAAHLPEVTEGIDKHSKTNRTWQVEGKVFAWERPFSKADIRRFGDQAPPGGPILAIRTADLTEKEAILAANQDAFFTIPHFNGFAAYLVQLDEVAEQDLQEALVDGWLAVAPRNLAERFLNRLSGPPGGSVEVQAGQFAAREHAELGVGLVQVVPDGAGAEE